MVMPRYLILSYTGESHTLRTDLQLQLVALCWCRDQVISEILIEPSQAEPSRATLMTSRVHVCIVNVVGTQFDTYQ
jgi:hypothetical protein